MKIPHLALLMLAIATSVLAQADLMSYYIAKEKNAADAETAKTYATAIVISGALIGLGLYFGLRGRKREPKP